MSAPTTSEPNWVEPLHQAFVGRPRPEDVARLVLKHAVGLRHRLKWMRRAHGISYMGTRYETPMPLTKSANVLAIFLDRPSLSDEDTFGQPMLDLIARGKEVLGATRNDRLDFLHGRMNRAQRSAAGIEMSRRRYNKLFRLVRFLETEFEGNVRFDELCQMMKSAKTGLLGHVTREEFASDRQTAVFVLYMGSRLGKRSIFTAGKQERAQDDLAKALQNDLFDSDTTNFFVAAHAVPSIELVERLTDEQKLVLLTRSINQMEKSATILRSLADESKIDIRESCVVRRGQNSSWWNAAAGAWNKSRDSWITVSLSLGLSFEDNLPGKVPRLIAADVARWHLSTGGKPHPDEFIVKELPLPWDALTSDTNCPAELVRDACKKLGVDPEQSGWVGARARTEVEPWRPTPELVHGVIINDPFAALVMRKMGWFAGPAKFERKNYEKNF